MKEKNEMGDRGEDCNRGLPATNGCEWRWEKKKRGERKRPKKKERQDDNAEKRGRIMRNEGIKEERDLEKARSTKSNVDGAGRGDRDNRRTDDTNRRRGRKGAAKHEARRRGRRGEEEPTVEEDDDDDDDAAATASRVAIFVNLFHAPSVCDI
ncbi:hypothetical protein ACLOJK_016167 [Asimina triloba]